MLCGAARAPEEVAVEREEGGGETGQRTIVLRPIATITTMPSPSIAASSLTCSRPTPNSHIHAASR
jgi:hypothetical protein